METMTYWEHTGIERVALRLMRRRFGTIPHGTADRLSELPGEQLEQLAEDLLDFQSPDDLERWFAQH